MLTACIARCKTVVEVLCPGNKVLVGAPNDSEINKRVDGIVVATRMKFYVSLACTLASVSAGMMYISRSDRPDEAAQAFDLCMIQSGIIFTVAITSEQLREVCQIYCRKEDALQGAKSLGERVLRVLAEVGSRFLPAPFAYFHLPLPREPVTLGDVVSSLAAGAVGLGTVVQLQPTFGKQGCLTCLNCTRATAAILATIGIMAKSATDAVEVAGFIETLRAHQ